MTTELQKEYDALGLPWEGEDEYCHIIDREMNLVVDASETTAARAEFIVMASNAYHSNQQTIEELTAKVERLHDALSALWGEWTDQKAQFGDEHLWKRHEDHEAINLAKEALAGRF